MSFDIILLALVDGISYAGLLFLVALGLTLIFGVMGILNVAHGALYAFGGYLASTLVMWAMSIGQAPTVVVALALVVSAIIVGAVLGSALEIGLLQHVQHKDPILQLLITFGAFLILE